MEHLGAQFGFPFAAGAGQPLTAQVADSTGCSELRQLLERPGQYSLMTLGIARRAEGPADGMIDERGARRNDFTHDVVRGADHQRRNAARFDDVSDKTDGLVAEGSVRNEQGEINGGFGELVRQCGSKLILNPCMLAHAAHKRQMNRRKPPDCSVCGKRSERCARKHDLRILLRNATDA